MRPPALRTAILRSFVDMVNAWPEEFAENFGPWPVARFAFPLVTPASPPAYIDP